MSDGELALPNPRRLELGDVRRGLCRVGAAPGVKVSVGVWPVQVGTIVAHGAYGCFHVLGPLDQLPLEPRALEPPPLPVLPTSRTQAKVVAPNSSPVRWPAWSIPDDVPMDSRMYSPCT